MHQSPTGRRQCRGHWSNSCILYTYGVLERLPPSAPSTYNRNPILFRLIVHHTHLEASHRLLGSASAAGPMIFGSHDRLIWRIQIQLLRMPQRFVAPTVLHRHDYVVPCINHLQIAIPEILPKIGCNLKSAPRLSVLKRTINYTQAARFMTYLRQ